jgi:glyceraldehyde 3-phosphate dehydrogenase
MTRVAINGMGRIGRAVLKMVRNTDGFEVVAVNDLLAVEQFVYLLRFDSVYGRYEKEVRAEGGDLVVDNGILKVFAEKDPSRLPWLDLAVDVVFECTGRFVDREGMSKHLDAGAKKGASVYSGEERRYSDGRLRCQPGG